LVFIYPDKVTKEEVHIFAGVCLLVCLSVSKIKLTQKRVQCIDLDEMLCVERGRDMDELINF